MPSKPRIKIVVTVLATVACAALALDALAERSRPATLTGVLVDRETRLPLRGEVAASFPVAGKILFLHTVTDEQGRFLFDELEAVSIHLATKVEGYATEHQTVPLAPGAKPAVELALTKLGVLRGVVSDPAGRRASGAVVRVIYRTEPPAPGDMQTAYQWETGEVATDAEGRFEVAVHPERELVLEASHPSFVGTVSGPHRLEGHAQETWVGLELGRGVSLAGTITDPAGSPVPGAQIRLLEISARGDLWGGLPGFVSHELLRQRHQVATSGADGGFRLEQVRPTAKLLVVTHPGHQPVRQVLEVSPSKALASIRIVLEDH